MEKLAQVVVRSSIVADSVERPNVTRRPKRGIVEMTFDGMMDSFIE
jgi:hypothetical protein